MRNLATIFGLIAATAAHSATFTVNAADNIYGAGQAAAPGGGNVPTAILKLSKTAACVEVTRISGSIACDSPEGCIEINNGSGNTPNDPDGVGAASPSSSNTGTSLISGITAPYAGYLVGVFTTKTGPAGPAPAALDFTMGNGTAFASLSPLLDQTFFIGDGRTGDGVGTKQAFVVPPGAAKLYLGISDACNYNGGPGCYDDNIGNYAVRLKVDKSSCP